LLVELRTPGFGVAGGLGLLSLGLFFWGHWIVQLAGWEEMLLLGAGLLLLVLEAFVLPGFGIAGVAGVLACIAALGFALVGGGATLPAVVNALGRVAFSLIVAFAGTLLLLRFIPALPFGRGLVLADAMNASRGYESAPVADRR